MSHRTDRKRRGDWAERLAITHVGADATVWRAMRHRPQLAVIAALALVAAGLAGASAAPDGPRAPRATATTASTAVAYVFVPPHPSVSGDVRISFRPRAQLPRGGYYYAVVVLEGYAGYSLAAPPQCSVSSDMQQTFYGYPKPGSAVHLTLFRARSASHRWCARGTYAGALYAVPHKPSCKGSYTCTGKPTVYPGGPCWGSGGHVVCGVIVNPEPKPTPKPEPYPYPETNPKPGPQPGPQPGPYSYPGGLPKPVDHSARVIAHFTLSF
jgi:hypothetical protein